MTRLTLSRSLTPCKVRYSVQLPGVTPTLALCFSMSLFLTSFPLESGCKSTHFFRFCKYHAHFFSEFFHTLVKIPCKTRRYAMHFFQGNPEGRNPAHIIIYTITERTGKCQEKIRKTADDRKTELSQSDAKRGKTEFSRFQKSGKREKSLQYNAEIYTRTTDHDSVNIGIILQHNAGFHTLTTSDCPITIIFRERDTAEKEIFLYVFSHAKRKIREKTATFPGNIASF